jgi:hypothetical protein
MLKSLFCAFAALIGSIIGASAPPEWRGDEWRYARISAATMQTADLTIVYRPYQRGQ